MFNNAPLKRRKVNQNFPDMDNGATSIKTVSPSITQTIYRATKKENGDAEYVEIGKIMGKAYKNSGEVIDVSPEKGEFTQKVTMGNDEQGFILCKIENYDPNKNFEVYTHLSDVKKNSNAEHAGAIEISINFPENVLMETSSENIKNNDETMLRWLAPARPSDQAPSSTNPVVPTPKLDELGLNRRSTDETMEVIELNAMNPYDQKYLNLSRKDRLKALSGFCMTD